MSVAVSHDGQWVVSGSKDRGVQFWDSRTAIVQCMLQGHKNSGMKLIISSFSVSNHAIVISIDLSPAGNILATGSGDWQARICMYNLGICLSGMVAYLFFLAGTYGPPPP